MIKLSDAIRFTSTRSTHRGLFVALSFSGDSLMIVTVDESERLEHEVYSDIANGWADKLDCNFCFQFKEIDEVCILDNDTLLINGKYISFVFNPMNFEVSKNDEVFMKWMNFENPHEITNDFIKRIYHLTTNIIPGPAILYLSGISPYIMCRIGQHCKKCPLKEMIVYCGAGEGIEYNRIIHNMVTLSGENVII